MPIAQRNGSAFISLLDLRTMIQPVLFPPQLPAGTKIKTICLDPGHGGKDPGYEVSRKQEKVLTLLLAKELRGLLNKAGVNVVLTRTTDSFVERPNRPEIAKRSRADLFVSLHYNSAGGTGIVARGVETYCLTPPRAQSTNARGDLDETRAVLGNLQDARNALLAYQIQKALVQKLSLEDRGVRRARWTVLQTATMPAILVECGFMSDPAEAGKIYDPAFRKRAAQAIVDGLMAYKRNVER
jgi:N-acetylmuramoyl-L-alanine amidase